MRRLLTPKWLAAHALAWLGVAACLALGWWQAGRALEGNMLSWAYTFEWPVFAIFIIVIWVREMRMAVRQPATDAPEEAVPTKRGPLITRPVAAAPIDDDDDPKLAEYNRYLAWLSTHPDANPKEYPC